MISFVAHSVGGLVARYAIGRLYRPPKSENVEDSITNRCEVDSRATIGGLKAMNFITVATPHLGSRGNKQVPYLSLWRNLFIEIYKFYHCPLLKSSLYFLKLIMLKY